MGRVLIGVDAGTSMIKAVAFSLDGEERYVSARENPVKNPRPGWAEQDMALTWHQTGAAIDDVTTDLSEGEEVVGVGVTGQGDGCWLIDDEGEPVRDAILWSDGRTTPYIDEWADDGTTQRAAAVCGSAVFPGTSAAIYRWLADNEPEATERAETVFFCKDWLKHELTGERVSDPSDMSLPYLDVETVEYAPEIPETFGVPELADLLPPLRPATEVVGTVTPEAAARTGLPEGTPVASSLFDMPSMAIGTGAIEPGDSSSIVGTTSVNQTLLDEPNTEPQGVGFTLPLGIEGLWTRAMAAMAGTPNLDWFLDEIVESRDFAAIESRIESIPVGAEGLLYHPYLSEAGERSPFLETTARASFSGLAPRHTEDHMIRAIYEGIAFSVRDCFEHIPAEPDTVRLSGGGARSDFWCRIFADCIDTPVVVPDGAEFGAKGAAMLAGIAVGEYDDVVEAVERTTTTARSYEPDEANAARYDRWYGLYKDVYESMFEHWRTREEILTDLEGEIE
jgi:sugar (pentulose or hexulose) kinase